MRCIFAEKVLDVLINIMRSLSGITLSNANGSGNATPWELITKAKANNTTENVEWYIETWCDRVLISALVVLLGKSLNTQAVFGNGATYTSGSPNTVKQRYATGTVNDKGLFWGSTSEYSSVNKIFGMENWWGLTHRRIAGLFRANGKWYYKLTYGTADGTTETGYYPENSHVPDVYYLDSGITPNATGYITKEVFGAWGFLPKTAGGSASTYYPDYVNITMNTMACAGGMLNSSGTSPTEPGAFFLSCYFGISTGDRSSLIDTTLSCKPIVAS